MQRRCLGGTAETTDKEEELSLVISFEVATISRSLPKLCLSCLLTISSSTSRSRSSPRFPFSAARSDNATIASWSTCLFCSSAARFTSRPRKVDLSITIKGVQSGELSMRSLCRRNRNVSRRQLHKLSLKILTCVHDKRSIHHRSPLPKIHNN